MKYRDDFFYLLNRLVNDGPLACGLSFYTFLSNIGCLKPTNALKKTKEKEL